MNEDQEHITSVDLPEQLSDILLVLNREKMKLEVVKGIGKNGELQTVPPTRAHQHEFMRVDKNGDVFSNFFTNFLRQLKNPTRFKFFKVSADEATGVAEKIQKHVDQPTQDGKVLTDKHKVKTKEINNQQTNQETMENKSNTQEQNAPKSNEYRYSVEQIDWNTMNKLGLSRERLEKKKLLEPLLKGYKTNELISINLNLGTVITKLDARLALQPGENGMATMAIHGIRNKPQLDFPFLGHEFSKEDKENLLKNGNMGRVVELTNPKNGEKIASLISIDKLTNELIAVGADKIKIPDTIKGVKLTDPQIQSLKEGKPIFLEGMISNKGEAFSANVQYNADKRYVEFLFEDSKKNNLKDQLQSSKTQTGESAETQNRRSNKQESETSASQKNEAVEDKKPVRSRGRKM